MAIDAIRIRANTIEDNANRLYRAIDQLQEVRRQIVADQIAIVALGAITVLAGTTAAVFAERVFGFIPTAIGVGTAGSILFLIAKSVIDKRIDKLYNF